MSDKNEDSLKKESVISEKLIEALVAYYHPAETFEDATDTKSTQELINEMIDMDEIYPYEVNRLLEEHGFKIMYNGSGYVWLLKTK